VAPSVSVSIVTDNDVDGLVSGERSIQSVPAIMSVVSAGMRSANVIDRNLSQSISLLENIVANLLMIKSGLDLRASRRFNCVLWQGQLGVGGGGGRPASMVRVGEPARREGGGAAADTDGGRAAGRGSWSVSCDGFSALKRKLFHAYVVGCAVATVL